MKIKKTIVSSVLAITLLSGTVASASGFNYQNIDYDRSYKNTYNKNVYTVTYDYRDYEKDYNYKWNTNKTPSYKEEANNVEYPVFNWEVVNNGSWGNKWAPIPESKPVEKPEIPQEDTSKPEAPEENTDKPVETPSVSGMSQIELEVLRLVNVERQKEGLSPLTSSREFSNVARKKSEDMAVKGYFSHTSPTYGSPFEMMKTFGISYRTAGENIAKGQTSAVSVMRAWMNSSGHRANIMNPSFNKIGIGMYEKNGKKYWTQMFTD